MKIIIIAAMASNRVIGRNGILPWHLPEDLKRFKELTVGETIFMGRKTYEKLPRVLSDRLVCVVTRAYGFTLDKYIEYFKNKTTTDKLLVCGGESIYKQALPYANEIILTRIDKEFEGDTYFPELGPEWKLKSVKYHLEESIPNSVQTWRRK